MSATLLDAMGASTLSPCPVTDRAVKKLAIAWALRLLGPVMLVIVIYRLPQPAELWQLLRRTHPGFLAAALGVNLLAIHLKVVRWQIMLRARGFVYRTRDAWLSFTSSLYLSMLTPGRVGDALRAQYLRHDLGMRYAEGLASIMMDRLCDLYVLAGLVAVAIAHYSAALGSELRLVSWTVVVLTLVGPLVLLVPGLAEALFARAYRKLGGADADGLDHFLGALRAQVGRPLLVTVPLTVVCFLVAATQGWLIAQALGLSLPFFEVLCLLAVASLLGLLPISVSGVGVREAFFAAVFPSLGHDRSEGVGYGLMVFAVIYLATAALGAVAWQIRPPPHGSSGK